MGKSNVDCVISGDYCCFYYSNGEWEIVTTYEYDAQQGIVGDRRNLSVIRRGEKLMHLDKADVAEFDKATFWLSDAVVTLALESRLAFLADVEDEEVK